MTKTYDEDLVNLKCPLCTSPEKVVIAHNSVEFLNHKCPITNYEHYITYYHNPLYKYINIKIKFNDNTISVYYCFNYPIHKKISFVLDYKDIHVLEDIKKLT